MTYTHYGWFGFCPVYIRNPWSYCPDLTERHPVFKPLMALNVFLQQISIFVCSVMNPDWVPTWKIRLSGKLKTPKRC